MSRLSAGTLAFFGFQRFTEICQNQAAITNIENYAWLSIRLHGN